LGAAVTVSGSMTFNLWALESANTENATLRVIVQRYDSQMQIQATVIDSTRTSATELTTTNAAVNWTGTPTSTVLNKGDRIRVRVIADDASGVNIGTGSVTLAYNGTTSAASGDSFVQFTEALTFASAPAGSVVHFTNVAAAVGTATRNREAWTSFGAASGAALGVTSTAGWRSPIQFGDSSTDTDWYTRPLQAFTLAGICRFSVWVDTFNADGFRCEVAVCNNDGSLVSVWGAANLGGGGNAIASAANTFDVSGLDVAITNGQRLRFRIYSDDKNGIAAGAGTLNEIVYDASSGGATDTFVTMTQTVSEYAPKAPPFQARTARNTLLRR
jgi:hypothetical protein